MATFGTNEQGFIAGGAAGAGTGALIGTMIAPGIGTAIGAGVGFLAGGLTANMQSQSSRLSQKRAAKEAEAARRLMVSRQAGLQQQSEDIATAGLRRPSSGQTQQPGAITPSGYIGQNLPTNAGTF